MTGVFFLTKQLEMHPRRLIRRFVGFAFSLFILLLIIAYVLLHTSSRNNLNAFYSDLSTHSLEFIHQQINERRSNLAILAALPQYREILEIAVEYGRQKALGSDSFSPENLISDEKTVRPFELFRELFQEHQSLVLALHTVEFITRDGFSLSGDFPDFKYLPFPYFEQLKSAAESRNSGNFLAVKATPRGTGLGWERGTVYFFQAVEGQTESVMGYLCLQLNLDMVVDILASRLPGQEYISPAAAKRDTGLYTIYKDIELYWISQAGEPLTTLRHNADYVRKLLDAGFQWDTSFPLVDPLLDADENDVSNIPIITRLVQHNDEEPVLLKDSYYSYHHKKVNGGGFWIEEINCGMVIEIETARVFSPYRSAFYFICIILLLSLFVTLYFILFINKLRETALDANPLTQLPGNRVINERIQFFLNKGQGAVVYGDLDNFKAYNDAYGFSLGDRVIQFTAEILKEQVGTFSMKKSFCGHIGGDDFIFIVPEKDVSAVTAEIGEKFDRRIRDFYNNVHLEKGFIEGKNREGAAVKYPVMAFSMAGVLLSRHHMKHYLEVANHCGELKKFSKKIHGSKLFMDRREDQPG